MRSVYVLAIVAAAACFAPAFVGEVEADTKYFSVSDGEGNWDSDPETNWWDSCARNNSVGDPVTNDDVIICDNMICHMDTSPTIRTITVNSGALLDIQSNKILTLNTDDGVSTFTGSVDINSSGEIAVDLGNGVDKEYTFTGAGNIEGLADSAKIRIDSATRLYNSTTIHGALQITELTTENNPGTLVMKTGIVDADRANGTISIYVYDVEDVGTSLSYFKSTNLTATLRFESILCLQPPCGDICLSYTEFDILKGLLDLDRKVRTKKKLLMQPGSTVDVSAGASGSTFSMIANCGE